MALVLARLRCTGDKEEGYEQLRRPDDIPMEEMFLYPFEINSDEHRTWLSSAGTI